MRLLKWVATTRGGTIYLGKMFLITNHCVNGEGLIQDPTWLNEYYDSIDFKCKKIMFYSAFDNHNYTSGPKN